MFSDTVEFLFLLFSRPLSFSSSSGMVLSRFDTGGRVSGRQRGAGDNDQRGGKGSNTQLSGVASQRNRHSAAVTGSEAAADVHTSLAGLAGSINRSGS